MAEKTSRHEREIIETRKQLEEELLEAHHNILPLPSRSDERSIITTFPAEIIADVFLHFALAYERRSEKRPFEKKRSGKKRFEGQEGPFLPSYSRPYGWIKVTHVCSHWRTVALSFPRLWSRIYLTGRDFVEEILARSKEASLSVFADAAHIRRDTLGPTSTLSRIMQELPRISGLRLCFASDFPLIRAWRYLTFPPSHSLQAMAISMDGSAPQQFTLPFLSMDYPSLWLFEIDIAHFKINESILSPSLRCLILVEPRTGWRSFAFSMDALSVLKQLPMLEHVDLCATVVRSAPSYTRVPASSNIATLSLLRYMRLEGLETSCASLLHHMLFPATTRIVIDCLVGATDTRLEPRYIMSVVASKLKRRRSSEAATPLQYFALDQGDSFQDYVLRGWTSYLDSLDDPSGRLAAGPDIQITLRIVGTYQRHITDHIPSMIVSACRRLPLSKVISLRVALDGAITERDWLTGFSQMTALRILRAKGHSVACLPDILLSPMALPREKGSKPTYVFQSLGSLVLQRIDLDLRFTSGQMALSLLRRFRVSLKARKKAGAGLSELKLDKCTSFALADIRKLEKVVGRVEWDGKERPRDGYDDYDEGDKSDESDSEYYSDSD